MASPPTDAPRGTSRRSFLGSLAAAGGLGALAAGVPGVLAQGGGDDGVSATGDQVLVKAGTDPFEAGRRLHQAFTTLVAHGGGTVVLETGEYRIPAPLVCRDHRDGTDKRALAIVGDASPLRGVLIKAGWKAHEHAMLDLTGSSHVHLRNVFFDGAYAGSPRASYGVLLARNGSASAGRHAFEHVTFTNFTRTAMVSHGSEMLTAVGCNFQRAPIGAVITAYPLRAGLTDADFTEHGRDLVDWAAAPVSNGGGVFVNTTFGDALVTSRAGVVLAQQSPTRHVGCVYQTRPGAEAKIILDECWGGHFSSPWSDQGGAPTVFKVGKYSPNHGPRNDKYQNRFDLFDAKIDANPGDVLIDGSNMKGCSVRNLWTSQMDARIRLDATCHWTLIENATNGIAATGKVPVEDEGVGTQVRFGAATSGIQRGAGAPGLGDFSVGEHGVYKDTLSGKVYYVLNDGGTLRTSELL